MVDALADQRVDDHLVVSQQRAVGGVHYGLIQPGQLGPQAAGNTKQSLIQTPMYKQLGIQRDYGIWLQLFL